jgi:antitoxin component of MazEF toxin-antitoxin module
MTHTYIRILRRLGGSLILAIPTDSARRLQLKVGSQVLIEATATAMTITPVDNHNQNQLTGKHHETQNTP